MLLFKEWLTVQPSSITDMAHILYGLILLFVADGLDKGSKVLVADCISILDLGDACLKSVGGSEFHELSCPGPAGDGKQRNPLEEEALYTLPIMTWKGHCPSVSIPSRELDLLGRIFTPAEADAACEYEPLHMLMLMLMPRMSNKVHIDILKLVAAVDPEVFVNSIP